MSYWSKSQGKVYDKIYKYYELKQNDVKGLLMKMYDPGTEAGVNEAFKFQKVYEQGNVANTTDLYSMCLIWIEMIFKERFWL